MKKSQRGFVVPVLLVVIALLVISGGVYVYQSKKTEAPTIIKTETQQTDQFQQQTNTQAPDNIVSEKQVSISPMPTNLEGFKNDICNKWKINDSTRTPKCRLSSGPAGPRNLEIKWDEMSPGEGELVIWNYSNNKNCAIALNEDTQAWKQFISPESLGEKIITEITNYKPLKISSISFEKQKQEIYGTNYVFCSPDNSFKFNVIRKEIVEKLYDQYFKY